MPHLPALATEFEQQVKRLRLTSGEYLYSSELRRWCERNNRCYIAEWRLDTWNISVDVNFSGAA